MRDEHGIQADGLAREFKGGIRAVDGIELAVAPGEIYGFLGPNGAGKSTTVHMLTTLLPPTAGTARVAGFDVAREGAQVRAAIGAALQEAALDPLLSGREHLRLQTALHGMPRAERRERSEALLERVGLMEAADRKVKTYSGGMKRRLDLALALVHEPSILFLDEPTTGLDPQSRNALWSEVARLAREDGVTVFLTTQYLEEADVLADRVGIIDHGRIVAAGTPAALKAEIGRPSVEAIPADPAELAAVARTLERFGAPVPGSPKGASVRLDGGEEALADVVRALDAEGLHLQHLQLHAPTLDDVFLAKTGRSLEGAGDEVEPEPEPAPARREPQPASPAGRVPRPALGAADAPAAAQRRALVRLPADPARRERGRARSRQPASRASRPTRTSTSRSPSPSCRARSSRRRTPAPISRATSRPASSTASRSRRCGARRSCSASWPA